MHGPGMHNVCHRNVDIEDFESMLGLGISPWTVHII